MALMNTSTESRKMGGVPTITRIVAAKASRGEHIVRTRRPTQARLERLAKLAAEEKDLFAETCDDALDDRTQWITSERIEGADDSYGADDCESIDYVRQSGQLIDDITLYFSVRKTPAWDE